ncbi:MAG: FHA domain-containing protein [Acidobacteriota bacterium]
MILPLAAAMPKQTALAISIGVAATVFVLIFVVLFLKTRVRPIARIGVVEGASKGRGIALKGRIKIGRDPSNDLALDDDELSRFHCEVRDDGGMAVLIDLRSANGTRVNGKDVMSTVLRPGDSIQIGAHVLKCS